MQFKLSIEEHTYLKIAIALAINHITTGADDSTECACLKNELQASILENALHHIYVETTSELDDDEAYHVQRAIALRLFSLAKAFLNDVVPTRQRYQFFLCEISYLLSVYSKLM